jgi:hypothetical protein
MNTSEMKTNLTLILAAALSLACIQSSNGQEETSYAKDKTSAATNKPAATTSDVPDFLREVVLNAAAPPAKQDLAFHNVYQLNNSMFTIYDNALGIYKKNIRARVPLIMALFSGKGGRFILYRPGQEPLEAPSVAPIYQLAKSVGHCAMATYECVAPYIADAKGDQSWVPMMKNYRVEVQTAKDSIADLNIKPEEKTLLQDTLTKMLAFMDACLKKGTFTYADVEAYARGVEPNAEKLIAVASSAQVSHWFEVLGEWKKLLGKDWDHTYALSNSIYVARQNNILFSVLVQFMGEEAINNRLLMLETTDFQTTPEDMLTAFARIVSDRALGKVFFNNDRLMDYELLGFGGRAAIEKEMAKLGKTALLPPLVPFNSTEWPWKIDPKSGSGPKSFDDLHQMGLLKP